MSWHSRGSAGGRVVGSGRLGGSPHAAGGSPKYVSVHSGEGGSGSVQSGASSDAAANRRPGRRGGGGGGGGIYGSVGHGSGVSSSEGELSEGTKSSRNTVESSGGVSGVSVSSRHMPVLLPGSVAESADSDDDERREKGALRGARRVSGGPSGAAADTTIVVGEPAPRRSSGRGRQAASPVGFAPVARTVTMDEVSGERAKSSEARRSSNAVMGRSPSSGAAAIDLTSDGIAGPATPQGRHSSFAQPSGRSGASPVTVGVAVHAGSRPSSGSRGLVGPGGNFDEAAARVATKGSLGSRRRRAARRSGGAAGDTDEAPSVGPDSSPQPGHVRRGRSLQRLTSMYKLPRGYSLHLRELLPTKASTGWSCCSCCRKSGAVARIPAGTSAAASSSAGSEADAEGEAEVKPFSQSQEDPGHDGRGAPHPAPSSTAPGTAAAKAAAAAAARRTGTKAPRRRRKRGAGTGPGAARDVHGCGAITSWVRNRLVPYVSHTVLLRFEKPASEYEFWWTRWDRGRRMRLGAMVFLGALSALHLLGRPLVYGLPVDKVVVSLLMTLSVAAVTAVAFLHHPPPWVVERWGAMTSLVQVLLVFHEAVLGPAWLCEGGQVVEPHVPGLEVLVEGTIEQDCLQLEAGVTPGSAGLSLMMFSWAAGPCLGQSFLWAPAVGVLVCLPLLWLTTFAGLAASHVGTTATWVAPASACAALASRFVEAIMRERFANMKSLAARYKELAKLRKRLAWERRERVAARASNKAYENQVSWVCHSLRNPLQGMMGITESVMDDEAVMRLEGPVKELRSAMTACQRMNSVLNDLLDLSGLRAGLLVVKPKRFRLMRVVEEVVSRIRARSHVPVTLESSMSVPEYIVADPARFEQVLGQGLENAARVTTRGSIVVRLSSHSARVHVTPDGLNGRRPSRAGSRSSAESGANDVEVAEVEVRRTSVSSVGGSQAGGRWVSAVMLKVEVIDTGPGLGDVDPSSLFREFPALVTQPRTNGSFLSVAHQGSQESIGSASQASGAGDVDGVARSTWGPGMGLPICARLMRLMDGSVTLQNRRATRGARFAFEIPCEPPGMRGHTAAGIETAEADLPISDQVTLEEGDFKVDGRPVRCLIVDDEDLNRKVMRRMLQRLGCESTELDDGDRVEAALEEAVGLDQPFDIIFLDIIMVRSNGEQVCSDLRAKGASQPIVAATGNCTDADWRRYQKRGFSDVLGKPYRRAELARVLTRQLYAHTPSSAPASKGPGTVSGSKGSSAFSDSDASGVEFASGSDPAPELPGGDAAGAGARRAGAGAGSSRRHGPTPLQAVAAGTTQR